MRAPFIKLWLLAIVLAGEAIACTASPFLQKRYVTYNFEDEGFLSSRVLQTIGQSEIETGATWGTAGARRRCLAAAEQNARQRTLRVLLHTRLDLQGNQADQALELGGPSFERDYPLRFSPRDLLRAEVDFRPLLDRGVIVLEENRKRDSCSVVYRIEAQNPVPNTDAIPDLPAEIRTVRLSFEPDIRQQRRNRQPNRAGQTSSGFGLPPVPEETSQPAGDGY